MKAFCITALSLSGLLATLCLLALPFWLMGVPGVENADAKGWKIGLYAVLLYPIAWLCVLVFWLGASKQMRPEHLSMLHLSVGAGVLVLLGVASGVVLYAFKVMSRT
jgi:hypothetical protein